MEREVRSKGRRAERGEESFALSRDRSSIGVGK